MDTQGVEFGRDECKRAKEHGIRLVEEPITELDVDEGRISAVRTGSGMEYRFDILYSALGMGIRSNLAVALSAEHDAAGALIVDDHNGTSVAGL